MKANEIAYTRLGRDDEWLIGVQASGSITSYAFAVLRDGVILLQGTFDLQPGEDLGERVGQAIADWTRRPGAWHALFHRGAQSMNITNPGIRDCRGKCPWQAPRSEFRAVTYTWSWTVPKEQRARGCMLFHEWESPPSAVQSG